MHIYSPPIPIEVWMDGMIEAVQAGLIQAVGVSNYNRQQMDRAYNRLQKEGIPLASNQVEYHLLNRRVELNGLLSLCSEMGVTLIAYSPLAMGLLTGKYSAGSPMGGFRGRRMARFSLQKIQPLIMLMKKIGANHDGKTPAQVALNWIVQKGALPIPGVKNPAQAAQNIGALNWTLSLEEMDLLDQGSQQVTQESN
jgi:aryl-alcohol dehydrogenase-like predicted oxidoreductase